MPIDAVQRLIYRNFVQRPALNRALDHFGAALNRIGIPYANGLTRNKAILFASNDPFEVQNAREALWKSGRKRAEWAGYDNATGGRPLIERFNHFIFDVRLGDDPAIALGMGAGGATTGHPQIKKALNLLNTFKVWEPNKIIRSLLDAKFTPDEIVPLLSSIKQIAGDGALDACEALPQLVGIGFNKNEILSLVSSCKKRFSPDHYNPMRHGYEVLSIDLMELRKTGFNKDDLFALLSSLIQIGIHPNPAGDLVDDIKKFIGFGFEKDEVLSFLPSLVQTNSTFPWDAYKAVFNLFENIDMADPVVGRLAMKKFLAMLKCLTDYNRGKIIELINDHAFWFRILGRERFLPHFNLYMDALTNRNRLGFALFEGILAATEQEIIPHELTPQEVQRINRFIDRTHSFVPRLYQLCRKRGETFLDELMPLVEKVRRDQLGKDDLDKIINKYAQDGGLEILSAVIQMTIPLSGASFVKRAEAKDLLEKRINAGDLREHVPAALRNVVRSVELGRSEYALREGKTIDLTAISPILDGLRAEEKSELPELVSSVEKHLMNKEDDKAKEEVRQALYRYASRRDLLGEKVDRLGASDYYTLRLLEEIFKDKDCLALILEQALDRVNPELLKAEKSPLHHADALIKTIKNMWRGSGSHEEKIKRLAIMIARYRNEDIQEKVLGKLGEEAGLAAVLSAILNKDNQAAASRLKLIQEILSAPLFAVQKEKAKYQLTSAEETLGLNLQMVKGIPYGMWGLCAGICIASHDEPWEKPGFKLIAVTDEETGVAAGFIHVYEKMIEGKKVWTLPGIEPSTEFIGTVNPAEFYDKTMEQVIEMAKLAGAVAVYIPTNHNINSNRTDIQNVIDAKKYPHKKIPLVNWHRDYAFRDVFLVWQNSVAPDQNK